jgi:4-amino-4-deoxy-L-arabinose transferase
MERTPFLKQTLMILFILLVLVMAFCFQGIRAIWQPDEGYYASIAFSMNQQGQYLIPMLGEEIFLDKPPMLYWGMIAGLKLFGHSEFAVRAFSGLCFALTTFLIYGMGKGMSGKSSEGFWAGLIYATMGISFFAAGFATQDTPLVLFTTLSMLAFWQSVRPDATCSNLWKMVLCAAVGLGFLTKGPAALIPCGAMFVYLLTTRKIIRYFLTPWAIVGVALFAMLGLSWYAYVSSKQPGALNYFFDSMIWGRLASDKYQRNPGLIGARIYLLALLLGTMPWSVLWYGRDKGIRRYSSITTWKALRDDPARLLLVCWIVIPMIVLCLASSKLILYALPVFPAMALATAKLLPETAFAGRLNDPLYFQQISKRLSFVFVWIGLLLVSRLILGAVPTSSDCRSLWQELRPYIPTGEYEIVAVDERIDGLWFYDALEVENVTRRTKPYPSFIVPETIEMEVGDMQKDAYVHLFVTQGQKHLREIKNILSRSGWTIQQVQLKYDRWLLLCTPSPNIP